MLHQGGYTGTIVVEDDSVGGGGKKIGFLIREEDRADIENFITHYPKIVEDYIPVAIIGEGTFSTVYKALDVRHYERDNSSWIAGSRQDPFDAARLLALYQSLVAPVSSTRARKRVVSSQLNQCIRDFVEATYGITTANDEVALRDALLRRPPVFVALKRINATSGPKRIADELCFVRELQGLHHVVPLVTACRHEDQVIVVSPFFSGLDFRDLLLSLTVRDIASYMRLLLEALAHVHSHDIMHRDIKPSNFLFAREDDGNHRGLLVDFGLAQYEEQDYSKRLKTMGKKTDIPCPDTLKGSKLYNETKDLAPGYLHNDPRAIMKASRAGTRGFRAPEVLMKIAHQTVAIDVWSAGVILLTLLTRRYPFFQSTDDTDALVELGSIFGSVNMRCIANVYGRIWKCNIPSMPAMQIPWRALCSALNPTFSEHIPDECFDLLSRLLDLDYRTRITALQALDHPFLLNY